MISKQRFASRIERHKKMKEEAKADIQKYRQMLVTKQDSVTFGNIRDKVGEFRELWRSASTSSEKNRVYKLLIDKIVYDREDNGVTLEVLYK